MRSIRTAKTGGSAGGSPAHQVRPRQPDLRPRTGALAAMQAQCAAMEFDQGFCDRQTEADSVALVPMSVLDLFERQHYPFDILAADPHAVVLDHHHDAAVIRLDPDLDAAALAGELDRVRQQIE